MPRYAQYWVSSLFRETQLHIPQFCGICFPRREPNCETVSPGVSAKAQDHRVGHWRSFHTLSSKRPALHVHVRTYIAPPTQIPVGERWATWRGDTRKEQHWKKAYICTLSTVVVHLPERKARWVRIPLLELILTIFFHSTAAFLLLLHYYTYASFSLAGARFIEGNQGKYLWVNIRCTVSLQWGGASWLSICLSVSDPIAIGYTIHAGTHVSLTIQNTTNSRGQPIVRDPQLTRQIDRYVCLWCG